MAGKQIKILTRKDKTLTHFYRLMKVFRDHTLNAPVMSDEAVLSRWKCRFKQCQNEVGDTYCICGHKVKYAYSFVHRDTGEVIAPVGEECTRILLGIGVDEFQARAVVAKVPELFGGDIEAALSRGSASVSLFSAQSGFTLRAFDYCEDVGIIDAIDKEFLIEMTRKRTPYRRAEVFELAALIKRMCAALKE
jgi:hypothetical protein